MITDRLPPHSIEVEVGLIGSVLVDASVLEDVADRVAPGDFYRDDHRLVWQEIIGLWVDGEPVDTLTIADRLAASGTLDRVGGLDFIGRCAAEVPHSANAASYADIIKQKSIQRQLIDAHNEGLREIYSGTFTAEQLVDSATRRVMAVSDAGIKGETVRIDAVIPSVMAAIKRRQAGDVTGLSSGVSDLDEVTTGFQPGNLIYLAGRTSMGKTAFALNVAAHQTFYHRNPVLFVSLEMSRGEITERILVSRSGVDGHRVRTGIMPREDAMKLEHAQEQFGGTPLFIDDSAGQTAAQIIANSRRHRTKEGVRMVVIDLINHVEGEDRRESRREQMCVISRRFKQMARELVVPVLVLAQLNRGPENREGNRPRKSDLKECGNLEEDADVVLLLHRPEYYDPNDSPGQAVIIVDKNRNGPTRDVRVAFQKHLMRFDDLAGEIPQAMEGDHPF